jgi:tryptophan synthase alpha chain
MTNLGQYLKDKIKNNEKILITYLTAGINTDWIHLATDFLKSGSDALEIGIPFSDPIIDGPVIQMASDIALKNATNVSGILSELKNYSTEKPLLYMTYFNIIFRYGIKRFCSDAALSNISGLIVPDLPLEESYDLKKAALEHNLANVLLAAPSTSQARLEKIVQNTSGFIYVAGLMGVTGEREFVTESAISLVKRIKEISDMPTLVGIGISNKESASLICEYADGVIVGSALIRRVLNGQVNEALELITEIKKEIG